MWKAAMILAAAHAGAAHGQAGARFSLRGAQLGMSLEQFRASEPPMNPPLTGDAATVARFTYIAPQVLCSEDGEAMICHWDAATAQYPTVRERMNFDLGDHGSVSPEYRFVKAPGGYRLMEISAETNIADFDSLVSGYTKRYGVPKTSSRSVQNGLGAQFESTKVNWSKGNDILKLETRCGQIDLICIEFTDVALKRDYDKRAAQKKVDNF